MSVYPRLTGVPRPVQDGTVEKEVALTGGRLTPGVVKVGDTVRRPASCSSPFVAELLCHLDGQGFTGAPRYLGSDAVGRDVFSYLPGWIPARFQRWSDDQVDAAGRLLRALHEATSGSRLSGRYPVVCHHDPGPNNAVFSGGMPVAFIDFAMAAPGHQLEDLGYTAWTWCVSSKPGAPSPTVQAAQVRVLADAYGLNAASRSQLPDALLERQARNARWWQKPLDQPDPPVGEASRSASAGPSESTPIPQPTSRYFLQPSADLFR
ncbi:phosphotransferase family protein [Streptomyces sp. GTA36]